MSMFCVCLFSNTYRKTKTFCCLLAAFAHIYIKKETCVFSPEMMMHAHIHSVVLREDEKKLRALFVYPGHTHTRMP